MQKLQENKELLQMLLQGKIMDSNAVSANNPEEFEREADEQ